MNIVLDYKIEINVTEGSKTKECLAVFLREFTQKERKEHRALEKKFKKIFQKIQKIGKKEAALTEKAELYKLSENWEKSLKALSDKEALEFEIDELLEELEAIGGEDQDAFSEETAKNRFNMLVSGKGKEALEGYAEIKGYQNIMLALDKAKVELEKKQSGE